MGGDSRIFICSWIFSSLILASDAFALPSNSAQSLSGKLQDTLPYSLRTRPYSGWNTSVRGDIRTVGMGGATVGLGDSFLASTDNPAGLAMTLDGLDFHFSKNEIRDAAVQNAQNPIYLSSFGTAVNIHPWGLSVGSFTSYEEGQDYLLPSNAGKSAALQISTSELRLGIARLVELQDVSLAFGVALNFGTASEMLNNEVQQSSSVGYVVSGMAQLPERILLGVGYQAPMSYPFHPSAGSALANATLPGFYQTLQVPSRLVSGMGWIPNRIFRAGLSVGFVGETPGAALLRDNSVLVGEAWTVQPRFGFAYTFADFSTVHSSVFAGTYLEDTRIQGGARAHATMGVEARFWFVILGYGQDLSVNFVDSAVSVGIDVGRALAMAELIPKAWHPPYAGFFPKPFESSDTGLARPLVEDWIPEQHPIDAVKVGLALPGLVEKKIAQLGEGIGALHLRSEDEKKAKTSVKKKKSERKKHKKVKRKLASIPEKPLE